MDYVNLTPHAVRLNDGREFPPSGTVARVSARWEEPYEDVACVQYGLIEGLPEEPRSNTRYIVSGMVLAALRAFGCENWRFVAPATGHPDTVRDEKGRIVSVPCFVR